MRLNEWMNKMKGCNICHKVQEAKVQVVDGGSWPFKG